MLVSLQIDSFKNHRSLNFSWWWKNILSWPNGSGKTNILESIYLLINGFPPPGRTLSQLLPVSSPIVAVGGEFIKNNLPYSTRIGYSLEEKSLRFLSQGSRITKSGYLQTMPVRAILFSPIEMNILYLGPSLRRDFLDEAVRLAYPEFSAVQRNYTTVLRNRNSLLKNIREWTSPKDALNIWDTLFIEKAKAYYGYRQKFLSFVREGLGSIERLLEGRYRISFEYSTKVDLDNITESVGKYLQEKRERDIITGNTHIGPHLDDFFFLVHLGTTSIRSDEYLSRGENKTILLGLKFLEIFFIESVTSKKSILLLDDLFSELDTNHIAAILKNTENRQLFITAQNIPNFLTDNEEFTISQLY